MTPTLMPSSLTALVVEDDEINREVAQELLEQLGVQHVHLAEDGMQGLRKLRTLGQVDLVLVDIYMPDMDGIEFIGKLAELRFKGKVIIVSGVSIETLALAQQLAQEGGIQVVAAMEKPLRMDELARAIGLNAA